MDIPVSVKQRSLLTRHTEQGVVKVRDLSQGVCLLITTPDENYELVIGTPSRGVVLIASDGRFTHRDKGVLTGGFDPESGIFLPEIIGLGLKMVLSGERIGTIRTGPVLDCIVVGKDFRYSMWEFE